MATTTVPVRQGGLAEVHQDEPASLEDRLAGAHLAPSTKLPNLAEDFPGGTVTDEHGTYESQCILGEGGQGVALLLEDSAGGLSVGKILDVPRRYLETSRKLRGDFREMTALSQLDHPDLPGWHGLTTLPDGRLLLRRGFLPGVNLQEIIAQGPLDEATVVKYMTDVAEVLSYVHSVVPDGEEKPFVNRDVKPSNVIVGPDGKARLTDFGTAKVHDGTTLTETVGSPVYRPFEQEMGGGETASDVYSLSMTALHMLRGGSELPSNFHYVKLPGGAENVLDQFDISPALRAVLLKGLAHEVSDRYADGGELLSALQELPSQVLAPEVELPVVARDEYLEARIDECSVDLATKSGTRSKVYIVAGGVATAVATAALMTGWGLVPFGVGVGAVALDTLLTWKPAKKRESMFEALKNLPLAAKIGPDFDPDVARSYLERILYLEKPSGVAHWAAPGAVSEKLFFLDDGVPLIKYTYRGDSVGSHSIGHFDASLQVQSEGLVFNTIQSGQVRRFTLRNRDILRRAMQGHETFPLDVSEDDRAKIIRSAFRSMFAIMGREIPATLATLEALLPEVPYKTDILSAADHLVKGDVPAAVRPYRVMKKVVKAIGTWGGPYTRNQVRRKLDKAGIHYSVDQLIGEPLVVERLGPSLVEGYHLQEVEGFPYLLSLRHFTQEEK